MTTFIQILVILCAYQVAAYVVGPQHSSVVSMQRLRYKRPDVDSPADEDDDKMFDEFFDKRIKKEASDNPIDSEKGSKKKKKGPSFLYGLNRWEVLNRAVVAGVFVAGIGTGITIDSAINTNPDNLASRDAIDRNAPNPKLCLTYGYAFHLFNPCPPHPLTRFYRSSAIALDQRIFVTFNPFNVYVTQADTKPGCVLKPSNVVNLLRNQRNLISEEVPRFTHSITHTLTFYFRKSRHVRTVSILGHSSVTSTRNLS